MVLSSATGCRQVKDRVITSDGRAIAGDLQLIDGAGIIMDSGEITADYEEARIFLRENEGTCRGRITTRGRTLSVATPSGERSFALKDVDYIIWGSGAAENTLTMDVYAGEGWTGTGLEVSSGDVIYLTASGTVAMETGSSGPEGIDYFASSTSLVPGATNGQLVMMVGESRPVAAGSTWAGNSPGSGELLLAVNIPNMEDISESGGVYSVTILTTSGPGTENTVLYPARR